MLSGVLFEPAKKAPLIQVEVVRENRERGDDQGDRTYQLTSNIAFYQFVN